MTTFIAILVLAAVFWAGFVFGRISRSRPER